MPPNQPPIPPDAFTAATREDLLLPVHAALEDAAHADRSSFALVLEPGTYRSLTIGLDTTLYNRPAMDVHVVGRGPGPAVLHGCQLNIEASRIYLHNLVVTGYNGSSVPLQLRAATAVHAERLVLVGNRCGDPPPHHGGDWSEGRVISIRGGVRHRSAGPVAPTIGAAFAHCWFLDNAAYGRDDLDGFDAVVDTEGIDTLTFDHCLLAGNEATAGINPNGPVQLTLTRCLVHETRLRRAWLDLYANSRLAFQEGLCAIAGRFVWLHIGAATPRDAVQPLAVRDSTVAWTEPPPPRLVTLENSPPVPLPALPADLAQRALEAGRPDVERLIAALAPRQV